MSQRDADRFRTNLEHVLAAKITNGALDDQTASWVAQLDGVLRDRLVKIGLLAHRQSARLAEFLGSYMTSRNLDAKPGTLLVLGHTRRCLLEYFGAHRSLGSITQGDADEFHRFLIGQELAENTIRRRCGIAKQFFNTAVRKKLIASNPFSDLKASVVPIRKRDYYVKLDEAARVLEACPDAQ